MPLAFTSDVFKSLKYQLPSYNILYIYCLIVDAEIHHHWSPSDGVFWESLRDNIRSKKGHGNMKAFIWHQGTQGTKNSNCC